MAERSPLVTQAFVPLSTYSSPSRWARQEMLRVSLPASGSDSERLPRRSPVAMAGSHRCFCSSVPCVKMQRRRHGVRVHDAGQAHPAVGQLLDHADVGQQVEPESAVGLGDRDAEQAEVSHGRHDFGRERVAAFELRRRRDDVALHERAHRRDDLGANRLVDGLGAPRRSRRRRLPHGDNHTLHSC